MSAGGHSTCYADDDGLHCLGEVSGEILRADIVAVDLSTHRPSPTGCFITRGESGGSLECFGLFGGTLAEPALIEEWGVDVHGRQGDAVFRVATGERHVCWLGYGRARCRGDDTDAALGAHDLYGPRYILADEL